MDTWTDLSLVVEPDRIRALSRDARGYPIPYFAMADKDGKPDFRVVDRQRWLSAVRFRRCGICGIQLGKHIAFVGGPVSIHNRLFTDLPMHSSCAEYALRACPFLAAPSFAYSRKPAFVDGAATFTSDAVVEDRPLIFGLGVTSSFDPVALPDGTRALHASPFTAISWWKHGQPSSLTD